MLFGGVEMVASPRMDFMSSTGLPVECLVLFTEILDALSEVGKAMLIDVVAGVGEVLRKTVEALEYLCAVALVETPGDAVESLRETVERGGDVLVGVALVRESL